MEEDEGQFRFGTVVGGRCAVVRVCEVARCDVGLVVCAIHLVKDVSGGCSRGWWCIYN